MTRLAKVALAATLILPLPAMVLSRMTVVFPVRCVEDSPCRGYRSLPGDAYFAVSEGGCPYRVEPGERVYSLNPPLTRLGPFGLLRRDHGGVVLDGSQAKTDNYDARLTTTPDTLTFRTPEYTSNPGQWIRLSR